MAAIDDEVRTFVELQQRIDEIRENLARLVVGRVHRQRLEVVLGLEQEIEDFFVVPEPLRRVRTLG